MTLRRGGSSKDSPAGNEKEDATGVNNAIRGVHTPSPDIMSEDC